LRELQLRRMVQLIRRPGVQRYCEVGMNGGHSATAMLYATFAPPTHSHCEVLLRERLTRAQAGQSNRPGRRV
jgi:hypothetical protein